MPDQQFAGGTIPPWYNKTGAPPVKYTVPTEYKENFQRKAALRDAIRGSGETVMRMDTITEDEMQYLKSMEEQAELADFDRYVQTLVDPRKPGQMKWLMEIYPQFVERRIQQAHVDYSYAIRKQMIDQWGVNTFDDLHFLYLMDQGKIAGPGLANQADTAGKYSAGIFSPWAFKRHAREKDLRLPFASANFGDSARGRPGDWVSKDEITSGSGSSSKVTGRHVGFAGRGKEAMAKQMYGSETDRNAAGEGYGPDRDGSRMFSNLVPQAAAGVIAATGTGGR